MNNTVGRTVLSRLVAADHDADQTLMSSNTTALAVPAAGPTSGSASKQAEKESAAAQLKREQMLAERLHKELNEAREREAALQKEYEQGV